MRQQLTWTVQLRIGRRVNRKAAAVKVLVDAILGVWHRVTVRHLPSVPRP